LAEGDRLKPALGVPPAPPAPFVRDPEVPRGWDAAVAELIDLGLADPHGLPLRRYLESKRSAFSYGFFFEADDGPRVVTARGVTVRPEELAGKATLAEATETLRRDLERADSCRPKLGLLRAAVLYRAGEAGPLVGCIERHPTPEGTTDEEHAAALLRKAWGAALANRVGASFLTGAPEDTRRHAELALAFHERAEGALHPGDVRCVRAARDQASELAQPELLQEVPADARVERFAQQMTARRSADWRAAMIPLLDEAIDPLVAHLAKPPRASAEHGLTAAVRGPLAPGCGLIPASLVATRSLHFLSFGQVPDMMAMEDRLLGWERPDSEWAEAIRAALEPLGALSPEARLIRAIENAPPEGLPWYAGLVTGATLDGAPTGTEGLDRKALRAAPAVRTALARGFEAQAPGSYPWCELGLALARLDSKGARSVLAAEVAEAGDAVSCPGGAEHLIRWRAGEPGVLEAYGRRLVRSSGDGRFVELALAGGRGARRALDRGIEAALSEVRRERGVVAAAAALRALVFTDAVTLPAVQRTLLAALADARPAGVIEAADPHTLRMVEGTELWPRRSWTEGNPEARYEPGRQVRVRVKDMVGHLRSFRTQLADPLPESWPTLDPMAPKGQRDETLARMRDWIRSRSTR
jgi:hypothetical protein